MKHIQDLEIPGSAKEGTDRRRRRTMLASEGRKPTGCMLRAAELMKSKAFHKTFEAQTLQDNTVSTNETNQQ